MQETKENLFGKTGSGQTDKTQMENGARLMKFRFFASRTEAFIKVDLRVGCLMDVNASVREQRITLHVAKAHVLRMQQPLL